MSEPTADILDRLGDTDATPQERPDFLAERRTAFRPEFEALGIDPFSPAEERAFRDAVREVELDPEAATYLEFLYDECNRSSTLTNKRRSDDPRRLTHDRGLAFGNLINGVSARRRRAIADYARSLAFILDDGAATVDHVRAVAPYCLAHAIEFTNDFRAEHAKVVRDRDEREAMHLTRVLLAGIDRNCDDAAESVRLLNAAVRDDDLADDDRRRVERLVAGNPKPDHPHLETWAKQAGRALAERGDRIDVDGELMGSDGA